MKRSVLIVDDDMVARKLIVRLLEDTLTQEVKLIEAQDGQEALDRLNHHSIDVLVTDIFMPKVNGFNLTIQAKETVPGMRTIAFTSESNLTSKTRNLLNLAQNSGADYAITKESLPETLPSLVAKCLM